MDYVESVGIVIRRMRGDLNLSQDEVAARADIDRGYYSQIENGRRDIGLTTLARIASALETEDWAILKAAGRL